MGRYFAVAVLALLISIPTFFIHWLFGWACFLGLYYLGLRAIPAKAKEPR
jgi:hypothetical protein